MSTLATAQLQDDSDNEDEDYVPLPKSKGKRKATNNDDESSTSDSEGEDSDEPNKRAKVDEELKELAEERRRVALEELKDFERDEEVEEVKPIPIQEGMIKVQRARRFAGETIFETVELKASDPEAIAFLAKQKQHTATPAEAQVHNQPESTTMASQASSAPPAPLSTPNPKPKAPPGRRKPRASLESMSASLSKGKKMTTLAKSQMDWKKHTESDGLQDELSQNRKGGYLEKQAFLERVSERRLG